MSVGRITKFILGLLFLFEIPATLLAQDSQVQPQVTPQVAPQQLQILDVVRRKVNDSSGRAPRIIKEPIDMPFYVFNNSVYPPAKNFAPTGYMGDISDIILLGSYKIIFQEGYPCLKVKYLANGSNGWGGIMWQNPPNNWGDYNGGYNLSQANKLAFWARGEYGGEIVEVKAGGTLGHYPDSENLSSGVIKLTDEWKEYVFNLTEAEMYNISAGFGLIFTMANNPDGCVIYMDNIRYE